MLAPLPRPRENNPGFRIERSKQDCLHCDGHQPHVLGKVVTTQRVAPRREVFCQARLKLCGAVQWKAEGDNYHE